MFIMIYNLIWKLSIKLMQTFLNLKPNIFVNPKKVLVFKLNLNTQLFKIDN